eukprot:g2789.t1
MVLRGSKIKPDIGFKEAKEDVNESIEKLHEVEDIIDEERVRIWQKIGKIEDDSELSRAEILHVLQELHHRVIVLEKEKLEAQLNVYESNQRYYKIFKQILAGGLAGCTARTFVAPIDRTKILLQTQFVSSGGSPDKYRGVLHTFRRVVQEEGIANLWRGNVVNCIRVAPYSATQFVSYEQYKEFLTPSDGAEFTTFRRLLCGGMAGATATTITHPLDVLRLRIAVTPELKGIGNAVSHIYAENGLRTFYKGYTPTLLSLSPFIAINFSTFDALKTWYYPEGPPEKVEAQVTLLLGAIAGLTAQSICFPLDTVRRRMQLAGTNYKGTLDAFLTIPRKEGIRGLYKGMLPNAIKIVPNNGIRFLAYEFFKSVLGAESRKR